MTNKVSNGLLLAQLILEHGTALTQYADLQRRTRAENREPTDAELNELGQGDDAKRARFQAEIDAARLRLGS